MMDAMHATSGLVVVCNKFRFSRVLIGESNHCLSVQLYDRNVNNNLVLSNIHDPNVHRDRKLCWDKLISFRNSILEDNWVIGGDFNAILCPKEKKEGKPSGSLGSISFRKFCDDLDLVNILLKL
ncbi:hypothetical protein SUGI_0926870 [Cryptomeria japonica]|nr:hypothetical protein SUGI_0926870 [Cryptomeria japonica]